MKKILALFTALICVLALAGCVQTAAAPQVVNRMEATPEDAVEAYFENGKTVITVPYCEMSDGTWQTEEHTYQYQLELTGRMPNTSVESTYVILSNRENITFEQAWKASGLSSNLDDYFSPEDAVIVGHSIGTEPSQTPEKIWSEEEIINLFTNSPDHFVRDAAAIDAVAVTDFAFDLVGAVLYTKPDREEIWVAFVDAQGNAFSTGICAEIYADPELTYCGDGAVSLKLVSDDGTIYTHKLTVSILDGGVSYHHESNPEES